MNGHLELGRSQFIPRLGYGQRQLLPVVAKLKVPLVAIGTQALPVSGIDGLPLVFNPETPELALPVEKRRAGFRKLPYGMLPAARPGDPDFVDERRLMELAEKVLGAQREWGASVFVTPYHLVPATGERRMADILLAKLAMQVFDREGIKESRWADLPRQLLAGLAVDVTQLHEAPARELLLEEYSRLRVDGFWVRLLNYHDGGDPLDVDVGTRFLAQLEQRSQRPVVACGVGNLSLPLLAGGLSAVSIGLGVGERVQSPKRSDQWSGRARTVLHPSFHHSFQAKSSNARVAFERCPCHCGAHEATHPPQKKKEIDLHTCRVRIAQTADYTSGSLGERAQRLRESLTEATYHARSDLPKPRVTTMRTALDAMLSEPPDSVRKALA